MATRGAAKVGLCHNALSYRPFILAMVFFRLTSAFRACSFPMRNMNSRLWSLPKSDAAFSSQYSEMAIYSGDEEDIKSSLHLLAAKRPQLEVIMQSIRLSSSAAVDEIVWSAHCENLQVDCAILEPLFLGNSKLNCEMTAQGWDTYLTHRSRLLPTAPLEVPNIRFGDGGQYQKELDVAIAAVHKASFMSRSLQSRLLGGKGILSKDDKSPVTIADFAVQALVIYHLQKAFPDDLFIAEETSELLRADKSIRDAVLQALRASSDIGWTKEILYDIVDKGGFEGSGVRVWVLDPVDGTKGFMRGEHYCIALALLKDGVPTLSVLGCPNLHLKQVLNHSASSSSKNSENEGKDKNEKSDSVSEDAVGGGKEGEKEGVAMISKCRDRNSISYIEPLVQYPPRTPPNSLQSTTTTSSSSSSIPSPISLSDSADTPQSTPVSSSLSSSPLLSSSSSSPESVSLRESVYDRQLFSPHTGSICFAVTGRGAYSRSLSMELGAAFEVEVSSVESGPRSRLCESSEASHGDRSTTDKVSLTMGLQEEFIHLDGQCKYCVVGAGGAEGNLRLPPKGYIEKIWDHAPGGHFITEAGGQITDLSGQRLDFSKGRELDESVAGIIASNSKIHQLLLSATSDARRKDEDNVKKGIPSIRSEKMN